MAKNRSDVPPNFVPNGNGIYLEELLNNLKTITEEQAWAICYLGACALKCSTNAVQKEQVYLTKDGTIEVVVSSSAAGDLNFCNKVSWLAVCTTVKC